MRTPEAQIKQALLRPEQLCRQAAARYFAESHSSDTTVMPLAIQALEKYGRGDAAFRFIHVLCDLAQTEATIDWVVHELQQATGGEIYLNNLSRLLDHADPFLLGPRQDEILAAPGFLPPLAPAFRERQELLTWDAPKCWTELERIAEAGKNKIHTAEVDYDRAVRVIEALARQAQPDTDRILSLLSQKVEELDNSPMKWTEGFMVVLAGRMRLDSAIPLIVARLHEDGELLNEECMEALAWIGTEEAALALAEGFGQAEWSYRLFAADALGRIHSDASVQKILHLLTVEQEGDVRANLGRSLLASFPTEGVEVVRQMVLTQDYDSQMCDLREDLVAACTVMEAGFPELEVWSRELAERQRAPGQEDAGGPRNVPRAAAANPSHASQATIAAATPAAAALFGEKESRPQ